MIQLLQAWRPALPPLSEEEVAAEQVAAEQSQMMAADAQVQVPQPQAQVPQPQAQVPQRPRRPTNLLTALLCGHYPLLTAAVFAPRPCKKLNVGQAS